MAIRHGDQSLGIGVRGNERQRESVGIPFDDVDGLSADRTRHTDDRYLLHIPSTPL